MSNRCTFEWMAALQWLFCMSSFSSFPELLIPLPSVQSDKRYGQSLSHAVKRPTFRSICKEAWNAAAHANHVKLAKALNRVSWWTTPSPETSHLPSAAELPELPSQFNIIEVHWAARRPAALTSRFWQIHLQKEVNIFQSNRINTAEQVRPPRMGKHYYPSFSIVMLISERRSFYSNRRTACKANRFKVILFNKLSQTATNSFLLYVLC